MSHSDIDLFGTYLANSKNKLVRVKPIADEIGLLSTNQVKPLSMVDPESSLKFVPSVILRNFVRNYANQEDFQLNGLKTLLRILQRSDANGQVLKVMMVHLSKASVSVADAVHLYTQAEKLVVLPELNKETMNWKALAEQTMMHPEIVKTVNDFIKNFEKVQSMEPKYISVEFVDIPCYSIRGFSGLNKVYINNKHFTDNANEYAIDERAETISKMDIVCITMHECGHVRLRQVIGLDDSIYFTLKILKIFTNPKSIQHHTVTIAQPTSQRLGEFQQQFPTSNILPTFPKFLMQRL